MLINSRILQAPLTGVQRYLNEVLNAWPGALPQAIAPPAYASRGFKAHAWEQAVLPLRARGQLLWSPVHSGPLLYGRQVVTVHDVVPLDHPEWLNPTFARWYRFMLPRLIRNARHVIAISEFTRQRIVATTGVSESNISVIANGVGAGFKLVSSAEQIWMREQLNLADRPYVLSVGSKEPRKNLVRLFKAWHRALPHLPDDLHLVVAGAPGDARVFADHDLETLPARVITLDRVDDEWMPALYSASVFFVYLSLYEGFGLPPLEAMACATPVLVSEIDVMNEVVGDAAVKVSPFDVDAISAGLRQMANDSDLRQGLRDLALVQSGAFCWVKTAEQTRQLLRRFE